jgi:hypothetical protein
MPRAKTRCKEDNVARWKLACNDVMHMLIMIYDFDLAPISPNAHETVMYWARSVLNHIHLDIMQNADSQANIPVTSNAPQ